jgi:hypothetical protein
MILFLISIGFYYKSALYFKVYIQKNIVGHNTQPRFYELFFSKSSKAFKCLLNASFPACVAL